MKTLNLKVVTPKSVALEETITSITVPSSEGELTILPKHAALFAMLQEGIVRIQKEDSESFLSIGGGYVECNGDTIHLLVSRAYGQDDIDEAEVMQAQENAKKLIQKTTDESERQQALLVLKRSMIDMKLLQKVKRRKQPRN